MDPSESDSTSITTAMSKIERNCVPSVTLKIKSKNFCSEKWHAPDFVLVMDHRRSNENNGRCRGQSEQKEGRKTWGKMHSNRARILSRTMLPSWMYPSVWEIAFWTAKSCSIVFNTGGAITLTSSTGPWPQNRVSTMKTAIKMSIRANV